MNKVVLDANVFLKIFKEEHDSDQAKALIKYLMQSFTPIVVPCVVVNETLHACEREKINIDPACKLFTELQRVNLTFIPMTGTLIEKAQAITQMGHKNSGYPTFSDSVYHAIALQEQAIFITADRKHFAKTEHLGSIQLFSELDIQV